jgi:hypothetical protein
MNGDWTGFLLNGNITGSWDILGCMCMYIYICIYIFYRDLPSSKTNSLQTGKSSSSVSFFRYMTDSRFSSQFLVISNGMWFKRSQFKFNHLVSWIHMWDIPTWQYSVLAISMLCLVESPTLVRLPPLQTSFWANCDGSQSWLTYTTGWWFQPSEKYES